MNFEAITNNKKVLAWIDEMAAMTKPDKIVWIDGSEEQAEQLRAEACSTGEMIKLNQELLPGSLFSIDHVGMRYFVHPDRIFHMLYRLFMSQNIRKSWHFLHLPAPLLCKHNANAWCSWSVLLIAYTNIISHWQGCIC